MSLSRDEARAFLELSNGLGDVRRGLHRVYVMWHAQLYVVAVFLLLGTATLLVGVFSWWPLVFVGCTITFSAFLAGALLGGRHQRERRQLPR